MNLQHSGAMRVTRTSPREAHREVEVFLGAAPGHLSRKIFATDSGQSPMGLRVRNADVGGMNALICAPQLIKIAEVAVGKDIS